jgi:hypothetical protein
MSELLTYGYSNILLERFYDLKLSLPLMQARSAQFKERTSRARGTIHHSFTAV